MATHKKNPKLLGIFLFLYIPNQQLTKDPIFTLSTSFAFENGY